MSQSPRIKLRYDLLGSVDDLQLGFVAVDTLPPVTPWGTFPHSADTRTILRSYQHIRTARQYLTGRAEEEGSAL